MSYDADAWNRPDLLRKLNAKPCNNTKPGEFNVWGLSYTYAPTYCKEHNWPDILECKTDSQGKPYEWILHGLWPQFNDRDCSYPQFCEDKYNPSEEELFKILDTVASELKIDWKDIAPDYTNRNPQGRPLLDHEWKKHGTCSGMSPYDYLKLAFTKGVEYMNSSHEKNTNCYTKDTFEPTVCKK